MQFDRMFPKSAARADVLLLHAMIDLKSSAFDRVRTTLDTFVKTYAPIQAEVATLLKTANDGARFIAAAGPRTTSAPTRSIVELLKIDNQFFRY